MDSGKGMVNIMITKNDNKKLNNTINKISLVIRWKKESEQLFYNRASQIDKDYMYALQSIAQDEGCIPSSVSQDDQTKYYDHIWTDIKKLCDIYGCEVF